MSFYVTLFGMTNTYQKINEIITESDLSKEEKWEFTGIFAKTNDEALKPVLKLLQSDKRWVRILFDNYQEKKKVLVTGNMDAWRDVVERQKEELV